MATKEEMTKKYSEYKLARDQAKVRAEDLSVQLEEARKSVLIHDGAMQALARMIQEDEANERAAKALAEKLAAEAAKPKIEQPQPPAPCTETLKPSEDSASSSQPPASSPAASLSPRALRRATRRSSRTHLQELTGA